MTTLDHGILNVPLSKRGNIDAQIDRFKAAQASDQRAARKAHNLVMVGLRMTAKGLVARAPAERVLQLAIRFNITPAEMRAKLKSDAHWQPALAITLLTPKTEA